MKIHTLEYQIANMWRISLQGQISVTLTLFKVQATWFEI